LLALCLYIYIMHQYKKSQDLEVYEMDYMDNAHLQEVCDIRQPVIFDFKPVCNSVWNEFLPQNLAKYAGQMVEIKNTQDYYRGDNSNIDSVSVSFGVAKGLCDKDDQARYFSENNGEFLEITGFSKRLHEVDSLLKPAFTVATKPDILFGSAGTATPLQYHTYYRRFLCVALGRIRVKMLPWKHTTVLNPIYDYEHYEFRSPVLPGALTMDILEFDVAEGSVLFIPPYWWYSIQYLSSVDAPETLVYSVSYTTAMNLVSNIPNLGLYWLQQQNIVSKVSKVSKVSLDKKGVDVPATKSENTETPLNDQDPGEEKEDSDVVADLIDPSKNVQIVKLESIDRTKIVEEVISVNNI